jgi:predicted GNAT family acetyltransferase
MPLQVLTAHDAIRRALAPLIRADPVRNTLLATIADSLTTSAWCAAWDGGVAVRSAASFAVVIAGEAAPCALFAALGELPDLHAVAGPVPAVRAVVAALGRPVRHETAERLHRLERLRPPTVPGRSVLATVADIELVVRWYRAFTAEAHAHSAGRPDEQVARSIAASGCRLWLAQDGTPVAMAARRPLVAGCARVGPVYTPPEHRGQGYASAVTAAATRSILDEDGVAVLFTDLANPTANRIYFALGYRPVEDRLAVEFG